MLAKRNGKGAALSGTIGAMAKHVGAADAETGFSPTEPRAGTNDGDALRFYFEFHESVGVGYCAQIHDLAAAQVMLGNVGFNSREASIAVDVAGQRRGTTYVTGDGSAVRIVDELNSAEVFEEFERAVLESTKS